jgi:hypothetical protein
MISGIPVELITMMGSTIIGGFMSIWSQGIKARADREQQLIARVNATNKGIAAARTYENKGFQFTRRIIAILSILAIIVLPKAIAIFIPEINVTVGYTEMSSGFFSWLFGFESETTAWKTFQGFVITPLDTHLVSAIVGLYFGASIVKNS